MEYKPRSAIKGQALADFILEFSLEQDSSAMTLVVPLPEDEAELTTPSPWWTLYVDGAVNNEGEGA